MHLAAKGAFIRQEKGNGRNRAANINRAAGKAKARAHLVGDSLPPA